MAVKLAPTVPRVTSRAVRVTARWEGRGLNLMVPALDLAALAIASALISDAGLLGLAYVALVAFGLVASGSYRVRISPRLATHLPSLVARIALPVIPLAVTAGDGRSMLPLLRLSLVAAGLVSLA